MVTAGSPGFRRRTPGTHVLSSYERLHPRGPGLPGPSGRGSGRRGQATSARLAASGDRPGDARRRDRADRPVADRGHAARLRGVRRLVGAAVHHFRDLPPRSLVATSRPRAPQGRPRQHLPAHRRHLYAVLPAASQRHLTGRDADGDLVGGPARDRLPRVLGQRPALAAHAHLHGVRVCCGGRPPPVRRGRAALRRGRRRGRDGADRDRGCALPGRWRGLRLPPAEPVAPVVRLPRGLPHLHRARLHHPLRRRLAGDVLLALTWRVGDAVRRRPGTSATPYDVDLARRRRGTTSTWHVSDAVRRRPGTSATPDQRIGTRTVNVEPSPGAEARWMLPPRRATIRCEIASPTPLPGTPRVCASRDLRSMSKTAAWSDSEIPIPSSAHTISTEPSTSRSATRPSPSGRLNFTALLTTLT